MRLLLLAFLAGAAAVAAPAQDAAPGAQGPVWHVETIDGRSLDGTVSVADGSLRVVPAGGEAVTLLLGEAQTLRQRGVAEAGPHTGHRLWLRSGSVLPLADLAAAAAEGDGGGLAVTLTAAPPVVVPFRHVAALRFQREGIDLPSFDADRKAPSATADYLYVVRDGKAQRFSVAITAFRGDAVDFELRGQTLQTKLADVAGVVFGSAAGFAPDRQPGARATVVLTTGDRITGALQTMDQSLALRLDEGAVLAIPAAQVRAIEIESDRLRWLGALQPKVEQVPAFDRVWPWTVDRSPAGGPIRLGGQTYDRGLVLVPRTTLTFDLEGQFDVFAATIGIEDRGGPQANAVFRVRADGRLLHESPAVVAGAAPVVLDLPLQKARQLTLEVDFGKNFDLGDLCVFADARVLKR